MKRLFSILGRKPDSTAEPVATDPSSGSTTTFLTGDDKVDSRNVRLLLDTLAELISDTDLDQLVRKIVDRAIRAVGAERGILLLRDESGQLAVAVARDDRGNDLVDEFRYSTTIVRQVHETGRGESLKIGDSDAADLSASVVDLKLRAVMCVRLRVRDRVLGVIYVDSRATSRDFSDKDLRFFDALAVALAISLENARLVSEALERQRMQEALRIAQEILADLLPDDPGKFGGFDLAGSSIPADTAAGDYYDIIPREDGQFGIVVGDVTGHGVGPAMVMTSVRSALRLLFEDGLEEAAILGRLNRRLSEDLADDRFMSLLIGRLDPRARTFCFANAGQTAPVIRRANGSLQVLEGTGVALGVDEDCEYEAQPTVSLGAGDVVALFTDGIPEAKSVGDEMFGNDGLAAVLDECHERPARDIVEAIRRRVAEFTGQDEFEDDFTVVVLKALE